jgi:hypothetical protein
MTILDDVGFDQSADVYTANVTTGRFNVLQKAGLRCRLLHVNIHPAATSSDRAELAAIRDMIWDPLYSMPEQCQVVVGSTYWQPVAGTFGAFRDWDSVLVYRRAQVVRQQSGAF